MTSKPSIYLDASQQRKPANTGDSGRPRTPRHDAHWLDNLARIRLYSLAALLCLIGVIGVWLYQHFIAENPRFGPLALDYMPFWGASHLTLQGHWFDAYNVDIMARVETAEVPFAAKMGGYMPWLYPPVMMLLVAPASLLPFGPSYLCYATLGIAIYLCAMRLTTPWRTALLPVIAFPALMLVLISGQATGYTAGLAGLSLGLLRRHPIWAGIFSGLLFVKPHLALLLPLAFLCAGYWRALIACIVTVIVTNAIAALVFGIDIFPTFLAATKYAQWSISTGNAITARVPSFFSMARMLGAPLIVSFTLQALSALVAVAVLIDFWRKPCSFELRAAVLVCATFLVSPYLYDYDMLWFALLIGWWVRDGLARGWLRGEREWLLLLWITPILGLLVVVHIDFQFLPFITLATLAMLWRRRRQLARLPYATQDLPPPSPAARNVEVRS